MTPRAERAGKVTYVDADRIEIEGKKYPLRKFTGLNERTCLNQKPLVKMGQRSRRAKSLPTQRRLATGFCRSDVTSSSRSCRGKVSTSKTRSSCPNAS